MHKLKGYKLISFDICIHHETITTIKIMNLSTALNSFLLCLSFSLTPIPATFWPQLLQRNCSSSAVLSRLLNPQSSLYLTSAAFNKLFSPSILMHFLHVAPRTWHWIRFPPTPWIPFISSPPSHCHLMLETPGSVHGPLFLSVYTHAFKVLNMVNLQLISPSQTSLFYPILVYPIAYLTSLCGWVESSQI